MIFLLVFNQSVNYLAKPFEYVLVGIVLNQSEDDVLDNFKDLISLFLRHKLHLLSNKQNSHHYRFLVKHIIVRLLNLELNNVTVKESWLEFHLRREDSATMCMHVNKVVRMLEFGGAGVHLVKNNPLSERAYQSKQNAH